MQKVKAHIKLYVREAIATVIIDDNRNIVEIEEVEDIQDFDDVELKEIIYNV